jgi:hypothetical protein
VDDFVENIVINIVLLLEFSSAESSWQKAEEFGLAKGLVGPQNKRCNIYRGYIVRYIVRHPLARCCVDNVVRFWGSKLCDV